MAYETPPSSLSLPEPTPVKGSALSEPQAKAFAELKALCEKNKLYWPASDLENHPAHGSNSDVDLLRFLRARSYDAQGAYKQYSATAAWRRTYKLDETYDNVDIHKFGRMNRVQPQWTGRRDKQGIPVMVYVLAEVRPEDLSQIAKEDPDLSSIFLPAEYVNRFTLRLCTQLPHPSGLGSIIDKTVNIVDLSKVGLRKFWALLSVLQTASNMATAHYPETVERIFVVGAPYFFPTIWNLITRWFDPATRDKIFVLPASQATATLTQYIEPENLPKRFGGSLDWNMGMHPIPDAETGAMVGPLADGWIDGPIRYITRPEGDVIMAVGSKDGQVRREVLVELPKKESTRSVPLSNGQA
ncbi:hypothetical protein P7C71_g5978, partial [Lecanoromycetidae sp. Uapishka_2]